jgi:hypothetical protein
MDTEAPSRSSGVIEDPELAGSPPSESSAGSGGGEVIEDPELSGGPGDTPAAGDFGGPMTPESEVHLTLQSRANRDLRDEDPREETYESTTQLVLDATLRRSESLRFGLGLVGRYHVASLKHGLPDTAPMRYEFDALPTAGYIDASVASAGLHVRLGYQPVPLGRFDLFSATNVLSVADLRDGPATIPGTPEVGQMALKVDYSPGGWFSMQAVYVPFFMPHIMSFSDTDYALIPGNSKSSDAVIAALEDIVPADQLQAALRAHFGRATRDHAAMGVLSAFAPVPSFAHPQGAVRMTARGGLGELALMASTALEHMPTLRVSKAAIDAAADGDVDLNAISVEYKRFAVLSVDGTVDVPPFSIGFELAYQLHRTLYAVATAYPDDSYSIPVPGYTDMLQGGLRAEYVQSRTWLMAAEAFMQYAMSTPDDSHRGWMFYESGRFFRGVGGIFGYTSDFGLHLEVAAAWLSGPTYIVQPRLSYDITDQLQVEAGVFVIGGQTPPMYVTPILSLGGVYNNVDFGFVGLRLSL